MSEDTILRIEDIVKLTGYSKSTIYKKTSSGELKKVYNPHVGFNLYRLSDIKKWMAGEDAFIDEELDRFKSRFQKE